MWPVDFTKGPKVRKPMGRLGFYGGKLGSEDTGLSSAPPAHHMQEKPHWGPDAGQNSHQPPSCSR